LLPAAGGTGGVAPLGGTGGVGGTGGSGGDGTRGMGIAVRVRSFSTMLRPSMGS
jgi:hypothetical protein